ncbi:MAG: hypothetical protein QOE62_644 [Actinomycetota bacterium]|nr:hypothetical protein [Actinomycetota bacterium]
MAAVQKAVIAGCGAALLLLGACGGSKGAVSTTTSTSVGTSSSAAAGGSSSTTTVELPTTSLPCQPIPIPTTPVTSPTMSSSSLLTAVKQQGDGCVDHVIFDFNAKGTDPPGYTITYGEPPFVGDASGAQIAVAGNAFVVVKIKPGYGFDFETGKPTYTGPKNLPVGSTNHVKAIVETGDFEGVLTWVIGMDAKRPFSVQATGTPRHQLVVTVS